MAKQRACENAWEVCAFSRCKQDDVWTTAFCRHPSPPRRHSAKNAAETHTHTHRTISTIQTHTHAHHLHHTHTHTDIASTTTTIVAAVTTDQHVFFLLHLLGRADVVDKEMHEVLQQMALSKQRFACSTCKTGKGQSV